MREHHVHLTRHAHDFWMARGAVAVIAGLQLLFLNGAVALGPRWAAPAVELALLIPLSVGTGIAQHRVRNAAQAHHWMQVRRLRLWLRVAALALTGLVMAINLVELAGVTRALLGGGKGPSGQSLLLDALNIWFTNVVVFALWFWNIDRAGPASRGLNEHGRPDFLFPQMMGPGDGDPHWSPGFIDYFYVAFTNATAFSPTDTMPLSATAKLMMSVEAFVSLLTVGLVAARAVNILA